MRNDILRRSLCLLLSLICCLTLFPVSALAASDFSEDAGSARLAELQPDLSYVNPDTGFSAWVCDPAGRWDEAQRKATLEAFQPLTAWMDACAVCCEPWSEEQSQAMLDRMGHEDAVLLALDPGGTLYFYYQGLLEERFTEEDLDTLFHNAARRWWAQWREGEIVFGKDLADALLRALDGDETVFEEDEELLLSTYSDGSKAYSLRSAKQLYYLAEQGKLTEYSVYCICDELVLDRDLTLPAGSYLGLWGSRVQVPAGVTLTVEKGAELYFTDMSLAGTLVNRGHTGQSDTNWDDVLSRLEISGEVQNAGKLQVENMELSGTLVNEAGAELYHYSFQEPGSWDVSGQIQNYGEIEIDPGQLKGGKNIQLLEDGYCRNYDWDRYDPATGKAFTASAAPAGNSISTAQVRPYTGAVEFENPDTGYRAVILDELGLMSEEEHDQLLEDMKPLTRYGNAAFWSTEEYTRQEVEQARLKRRELFGLTSGTIFVVNMNVRKISLQNYGYIESLLPSSKANTITNNVRNYATRKDYYGCASRAFGQVLSLMEGNRIAQPMKYLSNACIALMLGLLLMLLLVFRHASSFVRPGAGEVLAAAGTGALSLYALNALKTGDDRRYSPQSDSSDSGGSSCSSCGGGGSSCSSCGSGGSSSF